jgi:mRNA interferase MazF
MRRGEIWTVSSGGPQIGKPRPAIIIQADRFDATDSIAVCALTTDIGEAPLLRLPVLPTAQNGLRQPCRLMIDRITTMPRSRLGMRIGQLEAEIVGELDRALIIFLGLAGSAARRRRMNRSIA